MTFFVDANPLIYAAGDGPGAESCLRVLEAIADGKAEGRTSAAALEEAWHISQRDYQGQLDAVVKNALTIFTPLLPVTEDVLRRALALEATAIGTNDRLHVATCIEEGIGTIFSADRGFDQVAGIRRVDPFDADAVDRLLAV